MKKITIMLLLLIISVPFAMAQVIDPPLPEYSQVFATFAAFVAAIPFVVEWIKKYIPIEGQWLAWVVGILLSMLGWVLNLGMFMDLLWYEAGLVGLFAGMSAVGLFNSGLIVWILTILGIIKVKK